jgi:putative zinc finger/helix-turn-helix YgiT family protein
MNRCVECGGPVGAGTAEDTIRVGKARVVVTYPVRRCGKCGEEYVDGEVSRRIDLLVAARVAELGEVSGEAFRFARKALGLRAIDLAELLDVSADTISRWERGAVAVDRAALALLAAAAADALDNRTTTLDRLRALAVGKRPAGALRLDYGKAS